LQKAGHITFYLNETRISLT